MWIPEDDRPLATTVRCPDCGATFSLAIRREWVLQQYLGQLVTPASGAALMGIPRNTINQWARRKRLHRKGGVEGAPLYLVDDLIELARPKREDAA
jgi:transposase-like protein